MKILQLNIWGGKLGRQIVELIEREQPDVVCFQEAVELEGEKTFFITTAKEISSLTDLRYTFSTPSFAFHLMNRKAYWGNIILSKFSFSNTNAVFTRGEFFDNFDFLEDDYNMRNLQHVEIDHGGKKLHVLNHHGHHIHQHKMGDAETMRQCDNAK